MGQVKQIKECTLFDPGKREREARPKRLQVKQRHFKVTYGALYILIEELSSGWTYQRGGWERGWGHSEKLKPFQVLTEEMEEGKGMVYNLRASILKKLEGEP